ncbi:VOC family protein [Vibrio genomosp. F10]|uniref:VOC family protein n=1 Tax=Vibrio genomosp. F10 TaxID=723171 RepID=UPI0003136D95|nr:VOC family protein [Vibrio genomosp. F10]OEF09831.1 glyoxalase [Vibrio genomosp. F10 str. 9ZB36]
MKNLDIVELKSFVPSKDFECSKRFYKKIGFEMASEMDEIAYFKKGSYSFLLQDFYEPTHCNNFMMHLLVENAESWHQHIMVIKDSSEFQIEVSELVSQPWGMLEFCLTDPSGVLWRIAQSN